MSKRNELEKALENFSKGFLKILENLVNRGLKLLGKPRVCLIIPARNEEKTIAKVIKAGKKSKYVTDILVVDSFSTDNTAKVAAEAGARVVRQYPEKKGKGGAIYTGIREANGEILVFVDADITNLTPQTIDKLVKPIVKEGYDHVIGNFKLERGRLQKLTALPLMNLFFPEIRFKQPLSGLFAAKASVLKELEIEEGWKVEAGLVIDMVMRGYRTKEVDLGEIIHKENPMDVKAVQAREVAEVIVRKAYEYGRIGVKMKALILAAKKDTVVVNGKEVPKYLVEVSKESVLENILSMLKEIGITEVSVVIGYKKGTMKKVGERIKGIKVRYVENDKWNDELLSFILGGVRIDRRFILFTEGMVFEKRLLERVIRENKKFVFCVDRRKGRKKVLVENGEMVKFDEKKGNCYFVGVGVLEPEIFEIAKKKYDQGIRSLEDFFRRVCEEYEIGACDISDVYWNSLKDEKELEEARKVFG